MTRTLSSPVARTAAASARPLVHCATRPTGARTGSARRSSVPARPTRPAPRRRWRPRLTRRGRVAVVLLVAGLLLAAFSLGRVSTQAASDAPPAPRHVTVQPGETLWQLAGRIAPHNDPRVVVAELERLNNLDGAGLRAGQELLVP